MVDLTDDEKRVIDAMKSLGAISENLLKDADQIAKAALIPKGRVANFLVSLVNKKVVKRVTRGKSAGYFIIAQV
jgi:hypothetical protein